MRLSRIIACVALVALLAGCRNSASDGQQASSTFYNAGNRQPATENLMEVKIPSGVSNHHIDYFTRSQNNDSTNIIIISPNYHRIIHKNNPIFDRKNFRFKFPNGEILKLKLYDHLKPSQK